jgi:hypothetical protein
LNINVARTNYPAKVIKSFNSQKNKKNCLVLLGSIYLLGETKLKLLKN